MQQVVKQACSRAGIECELKAVVGSGLSLVASLMGRTIPRG